MSNILAQTMTTFLIRNIMPNKEEVDERHNKKINEIISNYKLTKNYPRKKKKRIRKELNYNYSFYMSLHEWDKSMEFDW